MKKIAVIDLGTNGFRLQIAESEMPGTYRLIYHEAKELKLASEGISHIGNAAFERGVEAMRHFKNQLDTFDIQSVRAIGTATLRLADNGDDFIKAVKSATEIDIELISGTREADLIYKGMKRGIPLSNQPVLMVDVGGGSVECIIANATEHLWAESFNIGVAILKQEFHRNNPLTHNDIKQIELFLEQKTDGLKAAIVQFNPIKPVFACGTLDIIVRQLRGGAFWDYHVFSYAEFYQYYQSWAFKTHEALALIPHIPNEKVEMLAVSFVLMDWLTRSLQSQEIWASAHSMKAGILYEMTLGMK